MKESRHITQQQSAADMSRMSTQDCVTQFSSCEHDTIYRIDQNERAQTLTTNCEIITKWHDVFLMWDPANYDNITDTRLPWEKVWTPDIVLYNAAGDGEQAVSMLYG